MPVGPYKHIMDLFETYDGHNKHYGKLRAATDEELYMIADGCQYPLHPDAKYVPEIKRVIYNGPATIIMWADGTKTVVKCQPGDVYDPELGLAMAIAKKALGNKGRFNDIFKRWLPDEPYTPDQMAAIKEFWRKLP